MLGVRAEAHLADLGHPVDDRGDLLPESLGDIRGGVEGVLDDIVNESGDDRCVVEAKLTDDLCHLDRMADVRLTRGTHLAAVRLLGKTVGCHDLPCVKPSGVRRENARQLPGESVQADAPARDSLELWVHAAGLDLVPGRAPGGLRSSPSTLYPVRGSWLRARAPRK